MDEQFWLIVKDKPVLLASVMNALCGNAHISLEGDLSKCDFSHIPGTISTETQSLPRNTLWPKQDFVIIPLEPHTIQSILAQLKHLGRDLHAIIHIQIEKNGVREFGAYDNFHRDCVVSGPGVSEGLLQQLVSQDILYSFAPADKDRKD